ncbi:alpha-keto acid decarboxylase family protein [Nitrospira sp. Kam-Ns4a]
MRLAPYLFQRVAEAGVAHAFGLPGDLALPLFEALDASPLRLVLTTHEPAAGFAADAYARLRGLGLAVVTYGAGGLNLVNPIGQAYAEKSPVLVVSGAPDLAARSPDQLIHHKVKTFDTQRRIFEEVTVASTVLDDPLTASREIERVLGAVLHEKRPGYVEVPRDRAWMEIAPASAPTSPAPCADPLTVAEALQEIADRFARSRRPVILAGVEIMRLGLRQSLLRLAERYNLPVATSFMGKAVFPEHHPNFIGTYMGAAGHPYARRLVEESDCLLMLGAWLTDTETGLFTSAIPRQAVIQVLAHHVLVSQHRYDGVGLEAVLPALLKEPGGPPREFTNEFVREDIPKEGAFLLRGVMAALSALDDRHYTFITDCGDCLFGSVELNAEVILNPGYYASMGFGVPAALGAALAVPSRRPIAVVGDGGFQMTGMELATLVRYELEAIVIVLNNGGYRSLEALGADPKVCRLHPWDYVAVARALGATGVRAGSLAAFRLALERACDRKDVTLIEVVLPPGDASLSLSRLRDRLRAGSPAGPGFIRRGSTGPSSRLGPPGSGRRPGGRPRR